MGSNSLIRQLMIVMFSNPKPKSRNVKHKICIKRLFIFHYKSWDILTFSITPSYHLRCKIVAQIQNMQKFIVIRLFIAVYSCRTVALHSKKQIQMGDHSNFFWPKSYSYASYLVYYQNFISDIHYIF